MRPGLGFAACQSKKGNSLIIRLLPLQGVGLVWRIFTQGVALGYVLLPLRGVLLVSFDTPSSYICTAYHNSQFSTRELSTLNSQFEKMRKLITLLLALAAITSCDLAPNSSDTSKAKRFTNEVLLGYTPVKDQGHSSLCWAYAMLATIESEHIQMGDSVNLSVDYIARYQLDEQARFHFLSKGFNRMTLRGTAPLLLRLLDEYGIMPYDSYHARDINYNALTKRLEMLSNSSRNLSQMKQRTERLFDERIGALPKKVYMLGAEYTPLEFAHSVCMRGEYLAMTSFTHHRFGEAFVLEVPDNYSNELYYNVPIDVMMKRIERSLRTGHPVCWEGDTSELGFDFKRGVAELTKQRPYTQKQRQIEFENHHTTDDHCMVLIGIAHDENGKRYYIAKNSWGTGNQYGGLMYLSDQYVMMKTVAIVVKNINM